MSDKKTVKINGFVFTDEAEAEQAKKEAQGIHYVEERADMHHPETVLEIYNKMVKQELFETAVGYTYLKELQEYLIQNPAINNADILPIYVTHPMLEESLKKKLRISAKHQSDEKKKQGKADGYRKKYEITLFVSVILAISIIGMFIIASTSDNPTILNYENKLIDKYAEWEQELDEREAALNEREQMMEEP
jgi:hypothetical protein